MVMRSMSYTRFILPALALTMVGPIPFASAQRDGEFPLAPDLKYVKKDTRKATRDATMAAYLPEGLDFGPWWVIGPFANIGHLELDRPYPPEIEGFNSDAEYEGKHGSRITWRSTTFKDNGPMELRLFGKNHGDDQFNNDAAVYLYREIRLDEPMVLDVQLGSDDGLKLWFNGKVVVHADALRGWSSDQHYVRLILQPGVNKVLAKVVNHTAGFNFSFGYSSFVDPMLDAMLQYRLDLDFPRSPENAYYRMLTIPLPDEVVLEVGGLDIMADGRPIVATRRGEVWIVNDAYTDPPFDATFDRFAFGLHEPLGLAVHDDDVYLVQRPELTRLVDLDGDDRADRFETVNDDFGVSGNYHEFAFGPKRDLDGNMWVTLNVGFCGGLGKSIVPWRGWAAYVTPDGEWVPVCGGLRSPNGIGMNANGDMFYTDNQGDWVGTNKLSHLKSGTTQGHPSSNRWFDHPDGPGPNPGTPAAGPNGPIPMHEAAASMPSLQLPAVWFPYDRMGRSTSDILCDTTDGNFGPFGDQLFVGDQFSSSISRVFLEKIDGEYQGACFPFRVGFDCGVNRMRWGEDGSMFVGTTNRGWGSLGRKPYGLQRLVWTGKMPFEILEMRAKPDGFELTFTKPVDRATAADPASYSIKSFTYLYHEPYGSPEINTEALTITDAQVAADGLSVRLFIEGLRPGYVHELHAKGVRTAEGNKALLHQEAYYTLNRVPVE